MTRVTIGPLVQPLTLDEQRALDRFIAAAVARDLALIVRRDRDLQLVTATALIPDPQPAARPVEA